MMRLEIPVYADGRVEVSSNYGKDARTLVLGPMVHMKIPATLYSNERFESFSPSQARAIAASLMVCADDAERIGREW